MRLPSRPAIAAAAAVLALTSCGSGAQSGGSVTLT
ncbi:MAG: iron transporter, partial [Nonomuraea sp.]|nr:iron transporter [Nonomuraea sp.]